MKPGKNRSHKAESPGPGDTYKARHKEVGGCTNDSLGHPSTDYTEENYRVLFEHMAPGVFYQRKDGSLSDVNPAALRMFGLTYDQFIGKDSYDPQWKVVSETGEVLAPEKHPSMIALLTGKQVRDMVVGVFNPERNDIIWVKATATPMFRPGETSPYQVFVTMDDITELRGVHASLKESEERFRELFTRMPAAVAIYEAVGDGEDFIFRDFNAAAEAIEGIKKSDLAGKRVSEVFPGVIEFGLFDVFRRVLKSGEAEYYPAAVYRDHRDPGTWRENWVYKLASGEIIAIYHDITKRKQTEEKIKKAYALVNETQAISRTGGWEYDLATKRISWTDEVYRIHGVGKEFDPNDVTRNIEFYATEDREVLQEAFRRAVEQGEPYDLELELLPAGGGRIWVRTIGRPVLAGSQIIRISGNIIDITDRKTAEIALRESEERFSNAFKYAAIGMALISPEGRWLKVNQSICEIVGYSEDELQGMTFQDITHPDDLDTDLEYVRRMIAGELNTYQMEKRYFHKQGHIIWVLLSVSLVRDSHGQPRYFISQIENITERKLVEDRLRFINTILYTQTEASIDGILVVDESGKIISCNKRFIEMWGILPDVVSSGSDERAIALVLDKLVDPGRFLSRVQYLYSHRQEKSRDEITLLDGRIFDRYTAPMIGTAGEYYGRFWSFRDSTEHRLAEEALRESEERLRQIAENSPSVFYTHDRASGRFIYVSPAYEKIWGRPRQELYDDPYSFLEAIDPDDMPSVQEAVRMELEEGKYFDLEYRIIQPGGEIRWIHSRNFPVLDKQGTVYRVIGVAEDITGRKFAENALRESEERFRKIFENSPVGMALVTPDFRFFSVNPAWVSMTGYPEPDLLNLSFSDITHPDYLAGDMEHIQELLAGTIPVYVTEKQYIRKDGSILWGSVRVTPIRDQQGSFLFFAAQIEDITERKLAEGALKESEEKLALVMDGVPTLIAYVDADLRLVYMNKAYAEWYGRTREELIGKRIADLLEKDVFERALPSYQAALRGEEVSLENNVRDSEGKERFVSVRLVPHFSGKEVSGFFASVMDITGRKQAEQSLAESEEKFRTMVEASPDMIWEIDTQGNFTYISPQCRVQLGYEPGDLIGQSIFSLIRTEDISTIRTALREHVQDNNSFSILEVPAHDKKGNQITIEIRSVPKLGSEGELTGFRGIARDITDSVLMHNTLKEREHFIQRILDTTPNLVYIFDIQDHRNIYSNREVANYLGYSSEEIISMGARLFEIILHPEDAERVAHHHATLGKAEDGEVLELEYRVKNADRRWRWLRSRDTVFARDEEGNVRQILGITDDITDQKNATDAIRETGAYTRSLIEAAVDPLVTITKDGMIGDVNAATEDATGYTRAELVGTDFSDYFTEPEKARSGFRQVFESGTVKDYPLEIRHRDGHIIPVLYNATVFKDSTGSVQGVFAAARDMTNLNVALEALRYSEEKYRDLAELMPQTIFETDLNGRFTYANRFAFNLFGYDSSELEKGLDISQMVIPDDVNRAKQNLAGIAQGNNESGNEYRFLLKNGGTFTGITYLSVIEKNGKPVGFRGIIADISERKHNEDVLRLSHTLLERANQLLELPALLQEYVQIIKDYTGCGAVGIRLLDLQGNIPYQAYTGFSEACYSTESPLSIKSDECMCIYVIRGTTDPTQPFFTPAGSFYMNDTTKFLATVSDEAKGRTRNACNLAGYESVALVPIRQGDRIIGLIHLADRRENLVPLATVEVIEEIADPLGSSIQRVSAERQVRESLDEKEVLLREIHHRVKNNLARVISLIGLQKAQLSDPGDIARFTDLEARIRSMSLVHESLYQSQSLSRINAQMYVQDLVRQLIQSYGPRPDIRWDIKLGDIVLPIDTAIHCGLIITEIVTNSIKYAFPEAGPCNKEEGGCNISVSMKETDGFITLNASDNGRGIPPGTVLSGPGSLGLTLIRILVKNQLHGDLEMDTTRGTSFVIRFVREPDTKGELYAG